MEGALKEDMQGIVHLVDDPEERAQLQSQIEQAEVNQEGILQVNQGEAPAAGNERSVFEEAFEKPDDQV